MEERRLATHHVKARKKGEKVWYFVTTRGGLNRLRIHAHTYYPDTVEQAVQAMTADNPGYDFRSQPIERK